MCVDKEVGLGLLSEILCSICIGTCKVIKRKRRLLLRKKFFKRNGGLLLKQQLSSNKDSMDETKIFKMKELQKATYNFNPSRVLGQGGQSTVYEGMLTDGRIVAVKTSRIDDESQVGQFINEVVILSKIRQRNILQILGCCLEAEVPLLVYEFILNGNLFELIHNQDDEFPVTWKKRLEIAAEVVGAPAYLHSVSAVPICHRDIKSSYILLDDKYRVKVADFGTSRSLAVDQTHLTTVVQGTLGYLDPEFFQSGQFTDKSDVFSFGVVLAELLTGRRPLTSRIGLEEKSLGTLFVNALEEGSLFAIIDERVAREGSKDGIVALATLAGRCLNINGKQRPTTKEVMLEIESIRRSHMPSKAPMELNYGQSFRNADMKPEDYDLTSTSLSNCAEIVPMDLCPLLSCCKGNREYMLNLEK